jgi:hypothetical protein
VEIEAVVVSGIDGLDAYELRRGLESELAALVRGHGLPPAWLAGGERLAAPLVELSPGADSRAAGVRIARALFEAGSR